MLLEMWVSVWSQLCINVLSAVGSAAVVSCNLTSTLSSSISGLARPLVVKLKMHLLTRYAIMLSGIACRGVLELSRLSIVYELNPIPTVRVLAENGATMTVAG